MIYSPAAHVRSVPLSDVLVARTVLLVVSFASAIQAVMTMTVVRILTE